LIYQLPLPDHVPAPAATRPLFQNFRHHVDRVSNEHRLPKFPVLDTDKRQRANLRSGAAEPGDKRKAQQTMSNRPAVGSLLSKLVVHVQWIVVPSHSGKIDDIRFRNRPPWTRPDIPHAQMFEIQ
jgi:hypothetical protein